MKVQYKTRDGRCLFEVQAETPKELFKGIAQIQDIFEADTACGCCASTNLRYSVRTVDDNDYYDLQCSDCTASLSFGQHKKGGSLFPRRKEQGGAILPNRGWKKWDRTIAPPADGLVSQPRRSQ